MTQARIKNMVCGVLASAAVSAFVYHGSCEQLDMNMQEPSCIMYPRTPLDDYPETDYYRIVSEEAGIFEKIFILHDFISNLIEKSEDLDPMFSGFVDKHFWDLI